MVGEETPVGELGDVTVGAETEAEDPPENRVHPGCCFPSRKPHLESLKGKGGVFLDAKVPSPRDLSFPVTSIRSDEMSSMSSFCRTLLPPRSFAASTKWELLDRLGEPSSPFADALFRLMGA